MQKLNRNVFNLSLAYKFPKDSPEQFIPEDGVCQVCDRLKRNHPGVERAIAANGLTRVINREGTNILQSYPAVPYCNCEGVAVQKREDLEDRAHLPQKLATFETFEPRAGTEEALTASLQFALGKGPHLLLLTGGAGCGKTHILQSIGRMCLDAGQSVRYELVADLLDRLRATYSDESEESYEQAARLYRYPTYLLLDDIGLEKASEWVTEKITALVDDRYRNGRRLAVATNKNRVQIASTMGFRLASRLWDTDPNTAKVVQMTCSDYRMIER